MGCPSPVQAKLYIVGDGPLLQEAEQLVESLELQSTVRLLGRRSSGGDLFECADIGVFLPTDAEAFGFVLLEAMRCGVPVIASRVGGIPEVVQDGRTGILVDPNNRQAVGHAMLRMMRSPALRQEMGNNAYARWQSTFSQSRMLADYDGLFQRLADA